MKTILVTGGAGYIGSHTVVELINNGYKVVIYDSLINSSDKVLERIKSITNQDIFFVMGDIRNKKLLIETFNKYSCDAVIHFAALKSVKDSLSLPIEYYDNNFVGTLRLIEAMNFVGIKKIVFSSSATVYGEPKYLPMDEKHATSAINPYGMTKLFSEIFLNDLFLSDPDWQFSILRYFNPVGAHVSGLIGESPRNEPSNLMPIISKVAFGELPFLNIYGDDYDTQDGTCVRDYIHVVDLAKAHISAIHNLFFEKNSHNQNSIFNLGTGVGYSILELVRAFETVNEVKIPINFAQRRQGDVSSSFANPELANQILNWKARSDIFLMCEDSWRWKINNPYGY